MDIAELFSVRDKAALITGGSRGIGEMIARALVAAGARTYISSRSEQDCAALAAELSDEGVCIALPADLSTPDGCTQLAADLADHEPRLDILVNNAGASWGAPIEQYPAEGFDKVMNLNVRAVFLLTQALLPQLEAAGTDANPSRVINIGSIDGLYVPLFDSFAYSASKAAVHQLTRHVASVVAARSITVNAIAPGLFPSKMTAFMFDEHEQELIGRIPRGRAGTAEDIGGAVIFLASRAGAYVTGEVLCVDGGFGALR